MATTSLDLRTRIVATYDGEGHTREDVAQRYRVSLGIVKNFYPNVGPTVTSLRCTTALGASRRL